MSFELDKIQKSFKGLPKKEQEIYLELLKNLKVGSDGEIVRNQYYKELFYPDYAELPVSWEQFITDPYYAGNISREVLTRQDTGEKYLGDSMIWPFWKDFVKGLFTQSEAFEVCITGSIGCGKTTISLLIILYALYSRLLCLKSPTTFYKVPANQPITIVFLNVTLEAAALGIHKAFVSAIELCPWFTKEGGCRIHGKTNKYVWLPHGIQVVLAASTDHIIGKNVFMGALDEVNFGSESAKRNSGSSRKSVISLHKDCRRRMENRFMKKGRMPGFLIMLSSKNDDHDFLEQYIQSVQNLPSTTVVDKAYYKIAPASNFMAKRFYVGIGDSTKEHVLIGDDRQEAKEHESLGYDIEEVPYDFYPAFVQNLNTAVKDVCGRTGFSTKKLLPWPKKYNKQAILPNFFTKEIVVCGLDDVRGPTGLRLSNFVDDPESLRRNLDRPRFGHCDAAKNGDRMAISIGYCDKSISIDHWDDKTFETSKIIAPHFTIDFIIYIEAKVGSEIFLPLCRDLVIWLSDTVGMNIKKFTYDGWQSLESTQILKLAGFDSEVLSIDRNDLPYVNVRTCILEERLDLPIHTLLKDEMINLIWDRTRGKVDHTEFSSKDGSDSIAGTVWNAYQYYLSQSKGSSYVDQQKRAALTEVIRQFKDAEDGERHPQMPPLKDSLELI